MQHAIIAKLHKRVLCVQDKHGQIERPGPITQIQRHPYSIAQPPEAAKALQLTRHLRHLRGTQRGRGLYHGENSKGWTTLSRSIFDPCVLMANIIVKPVRLKRVLNQ
jgi:hypothetical protein